MKRIFSVFLSIGALSILAGPAMAKKKAQRLQITFTQCKGSLDEQILPANREVCAAFADKGKLTARQRATIYFQIGILQSYKPVGGSRDIPANMTIERAWYDKAIAADPTFEWPYLSAAESLEGNENGKAVAYVERGLEKTPNSSFLNAALAQMKISGSQPEQALMLCDKVMKAAPLDNVTATICGETYAITKKWEQSYAAFAEAEKTYRPSKPNSFGLRQRTNPTSGMAYTLSMRSQDQAAVDLLTAYLARKDVGFDVRMIRRDRAVYYEKLGKFAEAAADLDAYSTGAGLENVLEARIAQMIDLARAGKPKEAQTIANVIYGPAPLKFILRLQVKLRNAHFDDLEFTGKYDAQTKTALERCLSEPTCFGEVAGQRV